MLAKNQLHTAEITGLTSEGSGVCRVEEMAVFVPETAVGDVIELRIVKVMSSYAFGIVEKILTPSPDRILPDCPVYKKCGGCVYRHISYEAECRAKDTVVRDAFTRLGGLSPQFDSFISAEETCRYRNKAQFPLAVIDGRPVCGFYAPRSHRVIPVEDCPLQPEIFSRIVKCCLEVISRKKLPVYDEKTHTGVLRHIYIRKGTYSGQIMVCFVVRKEFSRQLSPLVNALTAQFPEIRDIEMNVNPNSTNVILGSQWATLFGSNITDTMCGDQLVISPPSFYQVNTVQAERLYRKALEYADPAPDAVVADLYCGAGTIGLSMADRVGSVVGVEIVPEAIEDAKRNAALNHIENAQFFCGDAGRVFGELREKGCSPDIILLDPPRKGCSQETLETVCQAAPEKIVMISCNPSTAARDAKWLCQNGYSAEKVAGADLFPRTRHVECVVLMSKQRS
ncbi:MAG: 23S rRNA (uracil(1939)-C(5))-methyltransferase RlmD [Ruminococcus sp.]|nr:23S rRNA (uracil(1939)-C(5))-methyltransferase RlmD [Ruminococcus sp.]